MRVKSAYISICIFFTNFVIMFVALNVGLAFFHGLRERAAAHAKPHHPRPELSKIRPDFTHAQAKQLAEENKGLARLSAWRYDSITLLRPKGYSGKYVNVSADGYRSGSYAEPWPPDASAYNVFVFGGSTTFGLGVEDSATIPAALQQFMNAAGRGQRVNVYNFGRVGYQSTQEMLLFLSLLRSRFVPQAAIFIDGLNDCHAWDLPDPNAPQDPHTLQFALDHLGPMPDAQTWTALVADGGDMPPRATFMDAFIELSIIRSERDPLMTIVSQLPIGRLTAATRDPALPTLPAQFSDHPPSKTDVIEGVLGRYLDNRDAIIALANANHIKLLFVWQPVPTYKYDRQYDYFGNSELLDDEWAIPVIYPAVDAMGTAGMLGTNFLDLSAIQESKKENLYVDPVHYTPVFNREIGQRIASFLQGTHLF